MKIETIGLSIRKTLWSNVFGVLEPRMDRLERQLDALKSSMEIDDDLIAEFEQTRSSADYQAAFTQAQPLVSVCIATYNRAGLLLERCLPSVLGQTYSNIEVVVVGDACTDETEAEMSRVTDPRVRFENLAVRGEYPDRGGHRWMVAGTVPMNEALRRAQGSFITHIDDDDAYMPDRIEKLVAFAQEHRSDVVFHPFEKQQSNGSWRRTSALSFRYGRVGTCSILYHEWFKRIPWDINAYRLEEPGDWNRLRKILYIGAKIDRCPDSLLRVFWTSKP